MQQSEGGESEYTEDEAPDVDELQSEDEDKVGNERSISLTDVFCVV